MTLDHADLPPFELKLATYWLKHPDRRTFEGIYFAPGQTLPPQYYNLWRGYGVEPKAGSWDLMSAHIAKVFCRGDRQSTQYFMGWMARAIQHMGEPGEVALVLRGKRGTGKSIFGREFGALFGQHFIQVSQARHLLGHHNAHLRDTVVVFADEAFWAGDKQGENVLKMLITEPEIPIDPKHRDVFTVKNVIHLIIASNNEWVVPAGPDERRFFVLDVADDHMQDTNYFARLLRQMHHEGGRAAMLYDLVRHDLTGFNVAEREVPGMRALAPSPTAAGAALQQPVIVRA